MYRPFSLGALHLPPRSAFDSHDSPPPRGGSTKKYLGAWRPSSFGRQQRLSEITIEPIKNLGDLGKMWGLCPLAPTQNRHCPSHPKTNWLMPLNHGCGTLSR